jgi:ATP-binding cassette subfamily B protein
MNSLQNAAASGARVFGFLGVEELEDETNKRVHFAPLGDEELQGKVEFDHIKFSYDSTREIIHDFSADIKPGMKVAIVGPTGAGKTTMVNLLMRFYETNAGDIKIDGVPVKEMTREELHAQFAMVLQDTWIFDGTLKENLIYNTPDVTDEDIKNVIHDAHLTHFVRSLPGGLNYVIKDGGSISGGQKQLITIARAMLKKSPMLILDEATSNVDTRTEEKIQEAMDRLTANKTSFVIAHRLSTIKNADLILVMKDGNIIEQGNHDELMKQDGFYASLYNSQFNLESDAMME